MPLSAIEIGFASWYGGKFQGRPTASGEPFDSNKLTAAHKSLPFGTIVRVTNLENNLMVEVRINDRGPFVEGRIIDLSRAAAYAIGITGKGIALVKLETIENRADPEKRPEIYTIQIGAYRVRENALRTKNKAERLGFEVKLEVTQKGLNRVLIVNVAADRLKQTEELLAVNGFKGLLVKKQELH
jgi:rare lipoprotein A